MYNLAAPSDTADMLLHCSNLWAFRFVCGPDSSHVGRQLESNSLLIEGSRWTSVDRFWVTLGGRNSGVGCSLIGCMAVWPLPLPPEQGCWNLNIWCPVVTGRGTGMQPCLDQDLNQG